MTKIEQLNEELNSRFEENKTWFYTSNFKDSEFVDVEIKQYLKIYENNFSENAFTFAFEALALYALDRATYSLFYLKDKSKYLEEFSLYSYYSHMTIHENSKAAKCLKGYPELDMIRTTHLFASNIISKQWNQAFDIGNDLIDSLNAKSCIIRRGDENALVAWFLIELYSKISDYEINKRRAFYPKEFKPYDKILENWDTNDLSEVDKYVYILCDMHLEQQQEHFEDEVSMLDLPFMKLYPYEIIAWLNLREKQGLNNPKEFSHPLMNELIAKTLLEIKEPLEKPNEVPFLKEFLDHLYKKCRDVKRNELFK
ncbi:hypothetical protein KO488_00800 [Poseidonibacter lekithochrous]|uniref:hypothetical protein n=1 Tax=Poseidonibacter TaxID=2321187 RepID=UPI001C085F25|nr:MULTISPECIES: hypothetical protein [Poseidonibacter]MBU3013274.1 hypothetical protein [Poseidonibacter lekithochrous]MDO6826571.1 hypothetical protein [Poseidonibacter sp. 1_MG-2023]